MRKNGKCNIAIVGSTGLVGRTMMEVLQERNFPIGELHLLAGERSAGSLSQFNGTDIRVRNVADADFSTIDIGLFSAGASVSDYYAPRAAAQGCVVIDNTSRFRYDTDKPLVIPEVNASHIELYKQTNIISNPNCSTIQMLVALKPIHDAAVIKRINVCTYQSVSGAGRLAMNELTTQTTHLLNTQAMDTRVDKKQMAFNSIPQIDIFLDSGYTREEMKMVWETRKILGDESIEVNPTCVRVPVFIGHSEAIHIETEKKLTSAAARELLDKAQGVTVIDDPGADRYPTAALDATGRDDVFVGRIREDISHPRGLNMWVVADNLRKGAATNSVQIAEYLIEKYL